MITDILSQWQDWQLASHEPRQENLKPLPGGLTNRCFLLPLDSGLYVLRIHGQNSRALDIDREAEFRIQRLVAAQGLAPAVRYRSHDGHYWIRDYAPGKTLRSQDLSLPLLKAMASHLASLHALPLPDDVPRLSVADKASHYWNMIAAQPDMAAVCELRAELQSAFARAPDNRRCLCHMDPLPANWIQADDGSLTLLDWEYAAIGHPLWDLAALLSHARLSENEERQVLNAYGSRNLQGWDMAREQMNYLSALWYGAQGIWSARELEACLRGLLALNY